MDQVNQERRGMFGGLRVPFDLNMLVLAFVAVVGFYGLIELTEEVTGDANILTRIADRLTGGGLSAAGPLKPITWIVTGAIFLALWTFFSAAINRIAAMKIAREETLEVKDAAKFAAKKFVPVLASVLFVATILIVFYMICNATVAGWAMRVPGLDILASLLFFLVLLSTFFIVFSLVLGIFGMNLASSAIAAESSDTWDGISRAWNYILVRPWHVLLCYGLTAAYLAVFAFFAGLFLHWSVDSLAIGRWGAGERAVIETREVADLPLHLREAVPEGTKTASFMIPGKERFLEEYVFGIWSGDSVPFSYSEADRRYYESLPAETRKDIRNPPTDLFSPKPPVNVAAVVPGTWKVSGGIIWFWLWIARFAVAAYALQYFFAANTTLYFLLRKEVEDEDYSEIVVEEEELEEEAAWEVKEPAKPAGAAPAGGAPAGSGGPGAESGLKPLPAAGAGPSAGGAPAEPPQSSQTVPASAPAPGTPGEGNPEQPK